MKGGKMNDDLLIDYAMAIMVATIVGISWDMYRLYKERKKEDENEPHDPYNDIKEL